MSDTLKKVIRVAEKRDGLINKVPDDFLSAIEQVQNRIYRDLQSAVKELDVKGNALQNSSFNIRAAARLRDQIRLWLRDYGYYEQITAFGKQYRKVIDLAGEHFGALKLDDTFAKRDLEVLSKIKADDLGFLRGRDKDIINATYNEFVNAIYGKRDWRDLQKKLDELLTDTKTARGLLKKYTGTYANTAFASFDRKVMNIKANELGLEWFLYSGSGINDSRDFCRQRAGKAFTREQIAGWESLKWKGKISRGSVFISLGGYNCRHSLTPITEELAREINGE